MNPKIIIVIIIIIMEDDLGTPLHTGVPFIILSSFKITPWAIAVHFLQGHSTRVNYPTRQNTPFFDKLLIIRKVFLHLS